MEEEKLKIIFLGTPEFGAIILQGLVENNYKPVLVITETDKPAGRKHIIAPPPVKSLIMEHKTWDMPVLQPEKIENCKLEIENLKPDLGIVAAYGRIIPKDLLAIPKFGFINVHPSLLPKYRGPSPIQSAILNGDEETGVTIMLMDEKLDHGAILKNAKLKIKDEKLTYEELHDKLAAMGAKLIAETIPRWLNKEIKSVPQNEKTATYTKILKKEDGKIEWRKPAEEIERQIRAFLPWPGSFTDFADKGLKALKILRADVQKQTDRCPFGVPGKTFLATNDEIAVQTGKDFIIIKELQQEGGKPMEAGEFLNGHRDFIGTILK